MLVHHSTAKGFVIKKKNQVLGLSERFDDRVRQYVIGFKTPVMARKVQYNCHPDPTLRIERSDFINITQEVNTSLEILGIAGVNSSISIDVFATLYILKMNHPGGVSNPMNDGGFHLEEYALEDLYMMPFEKNIGLIMPYLIRDDDKKYMVFTCQVIDPVYSTNHFRKSLS